MVRAVNSSRGKVIEALFEHALEGARAQDKADGAHSQMWEAVRPTFEEELAKSKNANFEFSTLCGANVLQLYLSGPTWADEHIKDVFAVAYPRNCASAFAGLAYSQPSRPVYQKLVASGAIDWAVGQELPGRTVREQLIERIALAYLWGDEELDSSRWTALFHPARVADLESATHLFWSVRDDAITDVQRQKVIAFWKKSLDVTRQWPEVPNKFLSALGGLATFLQTADGEERRLLLAVAPYVHTGHNADQFVEQLHRLAQEDVALALLR